MNDQECRLVVSTTDGNEFSYAQDDVDTTNVADGILYVFDSDRSPIGIFAAGHWSSAAWLEPAEVELECLFEGECELVCEDELHECSGAKYCNCHEGDAIESCEADEPPESDLVNTCQRIFGIELTPAKAALLLAAISAA